VYSRQMDMGIANHNTTIGLVRYTLL
jgi:hypothetical protein